MGLGDETRKFAEAAEELHQREADKAAKKLNQKKSGKKGKPQPEENQGLAGEAQQFSESAAKLAEKMRPAEPTLDTVPLREEGFVGAAKDLNAKMYADANIIPQIDGLIDRHNDGSGIPKSEIESTFKDIMNQMVTDKVMTQEEMDSYTALSRVESQIQVDTGKTKQVPKNEEDRGIGNRIGNFLSGKSAEMETVKIFRTETTIVDGPSQFQQDINSSMEFNQGGKLESPNLESFKDKLMNTLSKICNSLGLKDLAQSCRQSIGKENLEKTYKAEEGMSNLTSKVAAQAKSIGKKAGTSKAGRVAEEDAKYFSEKARSPT